MSEHFDDAGKMDRIPLSALIGSSRRVAAEKMACRHEPGRPLAVCIHACKRCGQPIEPVFCTVCDGMGLSGTSDRRCVVCKGTGIDRWEASKWEVAT